MTDLRADIDQRIAAAAGMRRLSHAMVGHHVDSEVLEDIIEFTRIHAERAEAGANRNPALEFMKDPALLAKFMDTKVVELIEASNENGLFSHSMVSGRSNPMSVAVEYSFTGEEVTATVSLGPAFEGSPGMAHGGVIAAIVDETMGAVLPLVGTLAFTGELTISYRAPTPVGKKLIFRARLERRDGRKLFITCECTEGDNLLVEAKGLFIALK
jgi:acyl-coenzyme A thioesterase PaaI-like protein